MSISGKLDDFFYLLEARVLNSKQKMQLKELILEEIYYSDDLDDLKLAKSIVQNFIDYDDNASDRVVTSNLKSIGKYALVGAALGVGIGFFATSITSYGVVGSLLGAEYAGVNLCCSRNTIQKIGNEIDMHLDNKIESLTFMASPYIS